jgi:hypothetical protein
METDIVTTVDLVVDIANVMGSRPDGWWRDRAAAALRLVLSLAPLHGTEVEGPGVAPLRVGEIFAVVEGRARDLPEVAGITLVRAEADGDADVVRRCHELLAVERVPLAVTADRGLRARLPEGTVIVGPRWLRDLIDSR